MSRPAVSTNQRLGRAGRRPITGPDFGWYGGSIVIWIVNTVNRSRKDVSLLDRFQPLGAAIVPPDPPTQEDGWNGKKGKKKKHVSYRNSNVHQ